MSKIQISRIENHQSRDKNILILINTLKLGGGSQSVASRLTKEYVNLGYKVKLGFPLSSKVRDETLNRKKKEDNPFKYIN